jgi:hypothetical protein
MMRSGRDTTKLAILFLVLFLTLASGSAVAANGLRSSEPPTDAGTDLSDLLALPFISEGAGGVIIVDFSYDSDAAVEALTSAAEAIEGREIQVTGLAVADPDTRRYNDDLLSADDAPLEPVACPDRPVGPRSPDGSTTAYFGCDPVDGLTSFGRPVEDQPTKSLSIAFGDVLAHFLPKAEFDPVRVSMSGGAVVADIPGPVIDAMAEWQEADRVALGKALVFTAYSNGSVTSIEFEIDGSCLKYARLVGGDMCSVDTFAGSSTKG